VTPPWVAPTVGAAAGLFILAISASRAPRVVRRPVDPTPPEARLAWPAGRRSQPSRRLVVAAGALVAAAVAPPLVLVPPVAAWLLGRTRALRQQRGLERRIADGLPDAVDLLLLCTEAGWSLPIAHPEVAARVPPPLAGVLSAAVTAADAGVPRAEALVAALSPLGERARVLGRVLADHLHYGVALAPGLERLGLELRLDRRRRAEIEARRVPVRLLAPLVLCILPAFALLTVVPLLAASLRSLPT
jgi:tight adherence protein C